MPPVQALSGQAPSGRGAEGDGAEEREPCAAEERVAVRAARVKREPPERGRDEHRERHHRHFGRQPESESEREAPASRRREQGKGTSRRGIESRSTSRSAGRVHAIACVCAPGVCLELGLGVLARLGCVSRRLGVGASGGRGGDGGLGERLGMGWSARVGAPGEEQSCGCDARSDPRAECGHAAPTEAQKHPEGDRHLEVALLLYHHWKEAQHQH